MMTSLQHSSHSWLYLQKKQRPCINYMEIFQQDVNTSLRATLVDWLVGVSQQLKLVSETLFLAVNYIDRFLSQGAVPCSKLLLVGITCMMIAAKYEEIHPPMINKFCCITDNTYPLEEMLAMERQVHVSRSHMFLSCAMCCVT